MPSPQHTQKHWCCTHFTGEEIEAGKSIAACPKPPTKGGAELETQSARCDSMSYCVPETDSKLSEILPKEKKVKIHSPGRGTRP